MLSRCPRASIQYGISVLGITVSRGEIALWNPQAGGSVLTNFFCKDLGKGMHCGRPVCPPCNGDSAVRGNCRARNVTYESVCTLCNPTSRQEDDQMNIQHPGKESSIVTIPREGVYIGETSQSLHEHAVEHVNDAENFSVKSHIVNTGCHPILTSPLSQ